MEILFISGVSGAGKSSAMDVLEDLDFYCVDNMPLQLVPTFVDLIENAGYQKVAIATDVRSVPVSADIENCDAYLDSRHIAHSIIFLECGNAELLKRYKLSRRRHPLMQDKDKNIEHAIERERKLLTGIREKADYIIDTTFFKTPQLKERLLDILHEDKTEGMKLYSMSFGFKYGVPSEADLMLDVRCLPNPYYVAELKPKTGLDKEVRDYVLGSEKSKELFQKTADLISFLIPLYEAEGKSQLVIAFGCSGGHHRSVTFAEEIAAYLGEQGFSPTISHRDIEKV
ncbi:MAG: RNase adapter RapZ [Clostridia bacterium]|nr:RNase adapter RapZ [Clostridia bacterium]